MPDIDIDKLIRQQCEATDSLSLAYGHHMLAFAAKSLSSIVTALENGSFPHEPSIATRYITAMGYLAQYEAWVRNYMNGYVSKESKVYEEASKILKERITQTPLSK